MKPNFALDLSFDGITLLHRAGEAGWHVVGDVALDTPEFARDLAALRRKATTLDPAGLRTKIIIPDDQIRYLDIPAASAPHGDHDTAAADALDGATPYALDDLAFDWAVSGDRLQIAAVALETLDEAEGFAREHGFNPVSFVACPDPARYAGEPFFGMTEEAAATGLVERDTGPMKRLGAVPEPVDGNAPAPEAAPVTFSSIRAERGLPPVTAPRLEGVARITPGPLPDAEAQAISGAAQASLAPRDDADAAAPPPKPPAPTPSRKAAEGIAATGQKKSPLTAPPPPPAGETVTPPDSPAQSPVDEAERMTIFGARNKAGAKRGKPRFLGLALTAALLVIMIGVAAWAAIFPQSGIGRLIRGAEPQIAVTPDIPELAITAPSALDTAAETPAPGAATDTATETTPDIAPESAPESAPEPAPETAPEIAAVAPAPEPPTATWSEPRTLEEARTRYAATGIWPTAPDAPVEPETDHLDTFYQTSIDAALNFGDAIALPEASRLRAEPVPPRPALPPPPGTTFALDARGLVQATPEGALTPEGVRVHAGPPPVRPPDTPTRAVPVPGLSPTGAAAEARDALSGIRPRQRPETLLENHERGALGGRTRREMATLRPRLRPTTVTATRAAATTAATTGATDTVAIETALTGAMEQAVPASLKPRLRPAAIARSAAPPADPEPDAPQATAAPRIPTSASVARSATERSAINLRQVNLIGVYGTPSDRRALVRLSNGRYRKVQIGDRIDGGQVSAIGDTELRYTKSGRSVVLRLPRG
ncbi:hypothetical protein [Roseovarius sp. MBR-78]|uniref:hypothetical protein n=1 Tax=Roseovarius sp. MBR-78 TaxID=3156460 RepID=UPI003396C335